MRKDMKVLLNSVQIKNKKGEPCTFNLYTFYYNNFLAVVYTNAKGSKSLRIASNGVSSLSNHDKLTTKEGTAYLKRYFNLNGKEIYQRVFNASKEQYEALLSEVSMDTWQKDLKTKYDTALEKYKVEKAFYKDIIRNSLFTKEDYKRNKLKALVLLNYLRKNIITPSFIIGKGYKKKHERSVAYDYLVDIIVSNEFNYQIYDEAMETS